MTDECTNSTSHKKKCINSIGFEFSISKLSFIVMLSCDRIRKLFHINTLHISNANK